MTDTDKHAALEQVRTHRDNIDHETDLRDRAIKNVHDSGLASLREIADAAGVSHQTIANIINRQH